MGRPAIVRQAPSDQELEDPDMPALEVIEEEVAPEMVEDENNITVRK